MHPRKKPYLYTLPTGLRFTPKSVNLKKYGEFESKWLTIKNGTIKLPANYAWDGCSPKKPVLGLFIIGTPDGFIDHTGLPITAPASAVHDALCQYRPDHSITKHESVLIFNEMLKASKWPLRFAYVLAVKHFGPQGWSW